jgi:hypothetical protein
MMKRKKYVMREVFLITDCGDESPPHIFLHHISHQQKRSALPPPAFFALRPPIPNMKVARPQEPTAGTQALRVLERVLWKGATAHGAWLTDPQR